MMYGDYSKEKVHRDRDYDKNFNCLKYLMYTIDIVIFLAAIAMIGGTIWILIEWAFISDVMENQLFRAGIWLVVIGGGLLIMFVPISGCCGAMRESKCLLTFHIGMLGFSFLVLIAGGILAIVLRGEVGEWMIQKMENSLKDDYGVDLDNKHNHFITLQWDKAQKELYCCGVRDQTWSLYRSSKWYADQPTLYGDANTGTVGKPMVPPSCCKLDRDEKPVDINKCQRFLEGPPFRQHGAVGSNHYNNALHYRGCYEAGRQWVKYYSGWIIGLGVGFAGAALLGIVFSVMLLMRIRKSPY